MLRRERPKRVFSSLLEQDAFASAHASRSRSLFSRVIHAFGDSTFGDPL